jgi:phosphoribosylformylglycinamidine cyclo-ligase
VMNLDDMACAGALDQFVVSNTIGRNKRLVPGEVLTALIEGTAEVLDQLTDLGIAISLAGGETADVGDLVRTVDVGFTAVARLRRDAVKSISIRPGAVVVGILSDGQAPWEAAPNSGIGSNGLTYARHEVLHADYGRRYPESFDPGLDPSVVYTGKARLTDPSGVPGLDVGRLLLSPTRTHLPLLRSLSASLWGRIQGIIHTTGGGQTKVLHFLTSGRVVKDNLPPPPEVFRLIQSQRGADWRELYTVFNMGIRMEAYVEDLATADELIALAASLGLPAQVTGRVVQNATAEVVLTNPVTGALYTYSN